MHLLVFFKLIFNSSFSDVEVFHAYTCQVIDVFFYHVQFDEYEVWEVFVSNVQKLIKYYGLHHLFRGIKKSSLYGEIARLV